MWEAVLKHLSQCQIVRLLHKSGLTELASGMHSLQSPDPVHDLLL